MKVMKFGGTSVGSASTVLLKTFDSGVFYLEAD